MAAVASQKFVDAEPGTSRGAAATAPHGPLVPLTAGAAYVDDQPRHVQEAGASDLHRYQSDHSPRKVSER